VCTHLASFEKDCTGMHGRQNIKLSATLHKTVSRIYFYGFWFLLSFPWSRYFSFVSLCEILGTAMPIIFGISLPRLILKEKEVRWFETSEHYLPTHPASYSGVSMNSCTKFDVPVLSILTFWRLTTHIWVVPHHWPPNVAFYIFIQQIQVLNILNMLYTLRFFSLRNAVCFIMLTCLVPVLFTFYIQGVLKLKKK
jgi:hypothetical protein